ncbi:hypothetical protein SAMD00023353_1501030 [Rosellinia necatrix]|uniref:Uncharacterized protein n=1 Tax=Rosellinia necatrix TaxID=77044 RepID=A0A1W2TIW3_ROSNE|nr:hypothetical protein SAMD00023353_1501030 [Rosellinia necatrix]
MLPAICLLLTAPLLGRLAMADEVRCWAPDGKTLADNETVVPCNKLGIQQQGVYSSCCRLDGDATQRDYCTTNGLCLSTSDGAIRREYCTDKTWKSTACVNVCTDPNNDGSVNGPVEMTACSDGTGTYCCGRNQLGCCGTDRAIVIPTQGSVVTSPNVNADDSGTTFRNATIGLAAALGVLLITTVGIIIWLLRQNKSIKKQLSEKSEDVRHVPPPIITHPYSDSHDTSPPNYPAVSGSPNATYGIPVRQQRYSELDASIAASRSEIGSPVQHQYDVNKSSRSVISPPHSPFIET